MGIFTFFRLFVTIGLVISYSHAHAIQVGDRVELTADVVNVRSCASTSCSLLSTSARRGDLGVVVDGPQFANGFTWWDVDWDGSTSNGWTATNGTWYIAIPPSRPTPTFGSISSPGPTTTDTTPRLTWGSVSGATHYNLGVRDLTTNVLVVDIDNITSTSYTTSTLIAGRNYRWNMQACNSAGCSSFSPQYYFQIQGSVPGVPTPTFGSISSPGPTTTDTTPRLTWGSVSGATHYNLGVRDLTTNILVVDVDNITSTSYTTSTLIAGRNYRWNMQACNSAGCSSFSPQYYFQIQGSVPGVPTPTFGSISSPGPTTTDTTPRLTWGSVSGATHYNLGVRDLTTNILVVDVDNITSTSYTTSTLIAGRNYRWNMQACNSAGCSSFSPQYYFQIQDSVSVPGVPTPTFGSISSPGPTTTDTTPRLTWGSVSGATHYNLGVRDLTTNILVVDVDNITSTSYTTSTLIAGRNYRWNMQACNSAGCSSFSPRYFFSIEEPEIPIVLDEASPSIINADDIPTTITVAGSGFTRAMSVFTRPNGSGPWTEVTWRYRGSSEFEFDVNSAGCEDGSFSIYASSSSQQSAQLTLTITREDSCAVEREFVPPQSQLPPSQAKNAIILTHGFNSDVESWILDRTQQDGLGDEICKELRLTIIDYNSTDLSDSLNVLCADSNWEVLVLDWRSRASDSINPINAIGESHMQGLLLAEYLLGQRYEHVHLLAHSAGSNIIHQASRFINEANETIQKPIVHLTFFDAYDPYAQLKCGKQLSEYGKYADFSDNYVDIDELTEPFFKAGGLDATRLFMPHAFTVDVTEWDGRLFRDTIQKHEWPIEFYRDWTFESLPDPLGFRLSKESEFSFDSLKSRQGEVCTIGNRATGILPYCDSIQTSCKLAKASEYVLTLDSPAVVIFSVAQAVTGARSIIRAPGGSILNLILTSGSPSWYQATISIDRPINSLEADVTFTDGTEGFLTVLVNDSTVVNAHEVYLDDGESISYGDIYLGELNPGIHTIAFRLDTPTGKPSEVQVSNIKLKQVNRSGVVDDLCYPVISKNGRIVTICL